MRRHYLRSSIIAAAVILCAAALVLGAAGGPGPGEAAANGATSPFADVDNVILFIGDGMGLNHQEVGRQLSALAGKTFTIDQLPWGGEGMLDTASLDGITDSAAGGTALATGQATWNGWVSMGPERTAPRPFPDGA